MVVEVALPRVTYPSQQAIHRFYDRLESQLQAVPGVRATGATTRLPASALVITPTVPIAVEGVSRSDTTPSFALRLAATPGYFAAVGLEVVAGRAFTAVDQQDGVPTAIVSRGFARVLGMQPAEMIGHRVNLGFGTQEWTEVVGVVRDVRMHGPEGDLQPTVYAPFAQASLNATGFVLVEATGRRDEIVEAVRAALARVDPSIPAATLRTFGEVRSDYLAARRFTMTTLLTFGVLTAVLSAVGLFAIVSYLVRLRRREIAMRIVLGATPATVRRTVLLEGTTHALLGIVIGATSAVGLWQVVAAQVPGLQQLDPPRAALVCVAVLVLSIGAVWAPASRAARTDALALLRSDT